MKYVNLPLMKDIIFPRTPTVGERWSLTGIVINRDTVLREELTDIVITAVRHQDEPEWNPVLKAVVPQRRCYVTFHIPPDTNLYTRLAIVAGLTANTAVETGD